MKPKLRFQGFHDEWEEKKLGEFIDKIGDGLHGTPQYDNNGEYYFINGNNLINNRIKILEDTKRVDYTNIEFKFPTFLYSINGTIGNIARYNNESIMLGKSAAYFSHNNLTELNYIYYAIQGNYLKKQFMISLTGTTIKNLGLKTIKSSKVFIPSLSEQEKISAFLSQLDDSIEKQEQKIALLKERKKGWMQQLFSQTIRFKDENGQDYPAWEEKKLGEVAEIKGGYAFKSHDFTNNGVPVITISNISKYIYNNQLFSHSTLEDKKILIGEEKDILVALSGATTGKSGQIKEGKYYINQRIARIRHLNSKNLNPYIFNWINSNYFYRQLNTLLVAGAQPNLSIIDLNNLRISVPSLPEQEKIAEFLSKQDELIEKEEEKLSLLKAQKKGLLQQMFV